MKPLNEFIKESSIDNSKIENLLNEIFDNYTLGYDAAKKLKTYIKQNFDSFKKKTKYLIKLWLYKGDHTIQLYDLNQNIIIDLRNADVDNDIDKKDIKNLKAEINGDDIYFWIPNEIGEKFANKVE